MSYDEDTARDARFFILRELTEQIDGQLNHISLGRMLDSQGIRRAPEWVITQLNKLAELGAIEITRAGDIVIARITSAGRHHVASRSVIEGVSKPTSFG